MASPDAIEAAIKNAIDSIVNAVKTAFTKFKEHPLSVSNIKAIVVGVYHGVQDALKEAGVPLPHLPANLTLPNVNLPNITLPNVNLPNITLPSVPSLPSFPNPLDFKLEDWPTLCKVVWWPHHEKHCKAMRCIACSTSIMVAAKACEKTQRAADYRCLRDILGDGACNYCTADFLE
jgi:hypothetical protein